MCRYYSHFWPISHNTETFCRQYFIFLCLPASVLTFLFPRVVGNGEGPTDSMLTVNHGSGISKQVLHFETLIQKNEHLHFQKVPLKPSEVSNYYWGKSLHSCQESTCCWVNHICLSQNYNSLRAQSWYLKQFLRETVFTKKALAKWENDGKFPVLMKQIYIHISMQTCNVVILLHIEHNYWCIV